MGTHYDTLGVRPDADAAAIRAAYLAKARAHHPDRHVAALPAERARAARTMRDVNAAWTVLSDPSARRDYDATLAAPVRSAATTGTRPAATPGPRHAAATGAARVHGVEAHRSGRADDVDLFGRGLRLLPVLGIVAILLGIFVFTAFAATSDPDPPATTVAPGDLAVGNCVRADRVLTVVACNTTHDAVVASIVAVGRQCVRGTSIYTIDRSRIACLRPVP